MKQVLTENEMMNELKKRIDQLGSQKAVALKLGVQQSYLSDVMTGRRDISAKFAQKLGYTMERTYRLIETT